MPPPSPERLPPWTCSQQAAVHGHPLGAAPSLSPVRLAAPLELLPLVGCPKLPIGSSPQCNASKDKRGDMKPLLPTLARLLPPHAPLEGQRRPQRLTFHSSGGVCRAEAAESVGSFLRPLAGRQNDRDCDHRPGPRAQPRSQVLDIWGSSPSLVLTSLMWVACSSVL